METFKRKFILAVRLMYLTGFLLLFFVAYGCHKTDLPYNEQALAGLGTLVGIGTVITLLTYEDCKKRYAQAQLEKA